MQENDENTVNQKDEMPSQDTAHEYPDQEGASVPAEDDGNESRSRPNRGKQILRAVTEVAGVEVSMKRLRRSSKGHQRLQEVQSKNSSPKKRYGRQSPNGGRRYCLDTKFANPSCPADGYLPATEFQCRKNDVAASDATLLVL